MPTQEEFDELKRKVEALEARINTWALHGLAIADQRNLLLSPTGTNGTAVTLARSDHSH